MRLPGGSHVAAGGYVAGLCLALVVRPGPWWLVTAGVAGAAWAVLRGRRSRGVCAVVPLVVLCGLTVGLWRAAVVDDSTLATSIGRSGVVVGEVLTLPDVRGDQAGLDLLVTSFEGAACREKVRLQLQIGDRDDHGGPATGGSTDVSPGEVAGEDVTAAAGAAGPGRVDTADLSDPVAGLVEGTVVRIDGADLEPPPEGEAGEFDYGRYLRRRGQHVVVAAPLDACRVVGRRGGLAGAVDRLRLAARGHLRRGLRSPVRDVLEAMVLGDDNGVDLQVVDDFRRSGLLHIMAVSGENVVLLCAIAGLWLRLLGVPRGTRTALLIPMVCTYVVVTGASPSIVRAGVAGVAGLLAALVSRPADGWLLLLVPGAFILTVNPNSLYDVSFQLSFAAVVGLLTISRPLTAAAARVLPGSLAEQAGVTTAASIATAPVSILTFGSASVVSVAANLAAGFVLGPIMLLGMISVLVGFVSTWLSLPLNLIGGVLIAFMLSVAALFGRLPFAVWEWQGMTRGVTVAAALVLEGGGIALAARLRGRSVAALMRDRRLRRRLAAATAVVVAAAALVAPPPPRPPGRPTLTFLEVGEGAATLLQVPGGPTILFDAGPEPLGDTLADHGVDRLDLLVLSHGHADHTAGLTDVVGDLAIERAFVPAGSASSQSLARVVGELSGGGVPVSEVVTATRVAAGAASVEILPTGGGEGGGNQGENDRALVCVVTLAGERVLLPGDAEGQVLGPLALGRCAVVSLPHHGSAGGFSDAQLDELAPRLAVIPVGENRFGHPTDEMLRLLAADGVPCLRTDRAGDIALTATATGLRVTPSRR